MCVYVGFLICGCVYVWVFNVLVCMCGFCNVWLYVYVCFFWCVGVCMCVFFICGCVYVCVFHVLVCICVGFVICGCLYMCVL